MNGVVAELLKPSLLVLAEAGPNPVAPSTLIEFVSGAILAGLASGLFGFFWTQGALTDSEWRRNLFGSKPVALLASFGALFLARWGVVEIGPVQGVFWLIGTIVGIWLGRAKFIADYLAAASTLPRHQRDELRGYIRRNLFQTGHSQLEKNVQKKINSLQKERIRYLLDALAELHEFVHSARDDALRYLAEYKRLLAQFLEDKDFETFRQRVRERFLEYLARNLHKIVTLFEALTRRPRHVWVAVRVLTAAAKDGEGLYETVLRVGRYSKAREDQSTPVRFDTGIPQALREQYKRKDLYHNHKGILMLGRDRDPSLWTATPNDEFRDDLSVLAGPILLKHGNPLTGGERSTLYMILYVNSPEDNAFSEGDRDYMRCCTDVLSMFFSMSYSMLAEAGLEVTKL